MSFGGPEGSTGIPGFSLKKFESQNEVDEKKKLRQEEWEKVRKAEDPEECPEAAVDNRCLYDKLEEQRLKKDEEFEEKVAFKNQVKRLDADETDFLHFCTERQQEIDQERKQEEETVISELKQDAKVIKVLEGKQDEKKARPLQQQQGKRSQLSLLAGAVKRKGSEEVSANKKMRTDSKDTEISQKTEATTDSSAATTTTTAHDNNQSSASSQMARVIGVLPRALPGLTEYDDSSDSVSSSSDSEADFSISGRNNAVMIVRQQIQQHQH